MNGLFPLHKMNCRGSMLLQHPLTVGPLFLACFFLKDISTSVNIHLQQKRCLVTCYILGKDFKKFPLSWKPSASPRAKKLETRLLVKLFPFFSSKVLRLCVSPVSVYYSVLQLPDFPPQQVIVSLWVLKVLGWCFYITWLAMPICSKNKIWATGVTFLRKSPREFCSLFANKTEHWEGKWDLVKAIVNMGALKTLSAAPCLTVDNKQVVLFPFLSL